MKKTYISPKSLIVQIRLKSSVLTVSQQPDAYIETTGSGIDPGDFETKVVSDKSVWDSEW